MNRRTEHPESEARSKLLKGTILVVDENARDLALYSLELVKRGCQVIACASHSDAVARLESGEFNLVLVEQGGPLFKGRCLLEHILKLGLVTPVVVVADWADVAIYLDAMALGALDYVEKSSDASDLLQVVETSLQGSNEASRGHAKGPDVSETRRTIASIALFAALSLTFACA